MEVTETEIDKLSPKTGRFLAEDDKPRNALPSYWKGFDYPLTSTLSPVTALSIPCSRVLIQNATGNTNIATVGGPDGAVHELYGGQPLDMNIDNVNKVCAKGSGGVLHVSYWK